MRIDQLDHLVLTVRDLDATLAFYTRVLGMEAVTFAGGRRALAFGAQKSTSMYRAKSSSPRPTTPPRAQPTCAF